MKATTEILRNYIGGTLMVVERTLQSQLPDDETTALFHLRQVCLDAQSVMQSIPELDPPTAELLADTILRCIRLCASVEIHTGTNVTLQ